MLRQPRRINRSNCLALLFATLLTGTATAQQSQESTQSLSGKPSVPNGQILQRVLVKVNGDMITQTDLEEGTFDVIRRSSVRPTTEAELRQAIIDVTPQVISTTVDELLLIQQGQELGYLLTDDDFQEIVDGIKGENNFTTDEEFAEALMEAEGLTFDGLRDVMERQMLISQVQQVEILRKVTLTASEAREYYDNNLNDFTDPETVTMREILIRVPEGVGSINVVADERAKREAEEARQRVLAGEDFALVVGAVSDAASKENGGLIGPLDLAVVSDTVKAVLDTLEVDEVAPPVRTPAGYNVFQLVARTEPTPLPFEEVRDEIGDNVFNERRVSEYLSFLDRLREEADIDWKDEQVKQAFESYEPYRAQDIITGDR